MRGKLVDMDKLSQQNELMPAIGNMKVNARGDELGPGGKIIRRREEIMAAYYENNPKAAPRKVSAVKSTVAESAPAPVSSTPPERVAATESSTKSKKSQAGE
jgi:hypothetical protein